MTVKLINVFQVPPDQEDEFLRRWQETTAVYARTAGFVETHRNAGVGDQTFRFINIALCASKEAFIKAHDDYTPGEESIPGPRLPPGPVRGGDRNEEPPRTIGGKHVTCGAATTNSNDRG